MANPIERFLHGLMAQAGISPEQIVSAYQTVMGWQAELNTFKQVSGATVAHFNNRLNKLEIMHDQMMAQLDAICRHLGVTENVPITTQPLNGEAKHE